LCCHGWLTFVQIILANFPFYCKPSELSDNKDEEFTQYSSEVESEEEAPLANAGARGSVFGKKITSKKAATQVGARDEDELSYSDTVYVPRAPSSAHSSARGKGKGAAAKSGARGKDNGMKPAAKSGARTKPAAKSGARPKPAAKSGARKDTRTGRGNRKRNTGPTNSKQQMDFTVRRHLDSSENPIKRAQRMSTPRCFLDDYDADASDTSSVADQRCWPRVIIGQFIFTEQQPNANGGGGPKKYKKPRLLFNTGSAENSKYLRKQLSQKQLQQLEVQLHHNYESLKESCFAHPSIEQPQNNKLHARMAKKRRETQNK
jgi:hypothetical protein